MIIVQLLGNIMILMRKYIPKNETKSPVVIILFILVFCAIEI